MEDTDANNTEDILLVNQNTFMEEVQTYTTFQIANYIGKFWFPIMVPIGLIGNTLSFLVMIKPNNRKMSTCIFMAAISLNDNLMMFLALYDWSVTAMKMHKPITWTCKTAAFGVFVAMQNSTYQVLAMTLDKYIAIKWPHKAAIYSTAKRAKITVSCIMLCVVIYNIPHMFLSELVGGYCQGYANGGTVTKVYAWLSFILNAITPFFLLIFMNYVIIQKVRISRKTFRSNTYIQKGQGEQRVQSQIDTSKSQKTMKSTESQLTYMLLLVTTLFVVLMLPAYIRFVYGQFVTLNTPAKFASYVLFYQISQKLYNTNNAINFFLYCISGEKFRNNLKDILFCARKVDHHKSVTTSISSIDSSSGKRNISKINNISQSSPVE